MQFCKSKRKGNAEQENLCPYNSEQSCYSLLRIFNEALNVLRLFYLKWGSLLFLKTVGICARIQPKLLPASNFCIIHCTFCKIPSFFRLQTYLLRWNFWSSRSKKSSEKNYLYDSLIFTPVVNPGWEESSPERRRVACVAPCLSVSLSDPLPNEGIPLHSVRSRIHFRFSLEQNKTTTKAEARSQRWAAAYC